MILVVDDEELIRETLGDLLELENYDVTLARDGVEALEIFSHKKIDLVLTDIRMPQMDGIELLKNIKLLRPQTQVLLMTGYADVTPSEAMQWGASGLIRKPFDFDTISRSLGRVLNH